MGYYSNQVFYKPDHVTLLYSFSVEPSPPFLLVECRLLNFNILKTIILLLIIVSVMNTQTDNKTSTTGTRYVKASIPAAPTSPIYLVSNNIISFYHINI